jgi:hypothetical protein
VHSPNQIATEESYACGCEDNLDGRWPADDVERHIRVSNGRNEFKTIEVRSYCLRELIDHEYSCRLQRDHYLATHSSRHRDQVAEGSAHSGIDPNLKQQTKTRGSGLYAEPLVMGQIEIVGDWSGSAPRGDFDDEEGGGGDGKGEAGEGSVEAVHGVPFSVVAG